MNKSPYPPQGNNDKNMTHKYSKYEEPKIIDSS